MLLIHFYILQHFQILRKGTNVYLRAEVFLDHKKLDEVPDLDQPVFIPLNHLNQVVGKQIGR